MDKVFGQDYISQLLDCNFNNPCEDCPYKAICGYENKSNCCEGMFNKSTLTAERIA